MDPQNIQKKLKTGLLNDVAICSRRSGKLSEENKRGFHVEPIWPKCAHIIFFPGYGKNMGGFSILYQSEPQKKNDVFFCQARCKAQLSILDTDTDIVNFIYNWHIHFATSLRTQVCMPDNIPGKCKDNKWCSCLETIFQDRFCNVLKQQLYQIYI